MAALSLLLVTLYIALAVLGNRYWRYLRHKNRSAWPAEPRWTLALLDRDTGFRHNLDLDCRRWEPCAKADLQKSRACCCSLSARHRIEEAVSNGAYLGYLEATRKVTPAANLFTDSSIDIPQRPADGSGIVSPQKTSKRDGDQVSEEQQEPGGISGVLAQVRAELRKMWEAVAPLGNSGGSPADGWSLGPLLLQVECSEGSVAEL
eukprot:SAG31_NODE_9681_length_1242_cov_1.807524_1_plen_204_part_01